MSATTIAMQHPAPSALRRGRRFACGLGLAALAFAALAGCGGDSVTAPTGSIPDPPATALAPVTTGSGLIYQDFVVGAGASPVTGRAVTVDYTGWLTDGTKFDSSVDRGTPFTFTIGVGQVIAGWDEGVATMKVGGTRRLTLPPSLAYGSRGAGGGIIPPNATLVFDVQLLAVAASVPPR